MGFFCQRTDAAIVGDRDDRKNLTTIRQVVLDGLSIGIVEIVEIPASQVTGAAGVVAPLTWTCSDANLHRHMRLVLEQLCSDKTRTADAAGHGTETFVFARESTTAFMHMEQPGPSAGTVRPTTMAEAADRLRLMRERFEHIKQG